ncbi:hypothetical protein [Paenibacillus jilunlii]|nr:hypothetical protein [Paenibacillus jilunlii]
MISKQGDSLQVEMRGKSTFELCGSRRNGGMRGKSTFELCGNR